MALENELKTYHDQLPVLLADEGRFVLIHGDDVVGVYAAYEDAIKQGYADFGLEPFMVKQIQAVEQVQFVTRNIAPCLT